MRSGLESSERHSILPKSLKDLVALRMESLSLGLEITSKLLFYSSMGGALVSFLQVKSPIEVWSPISGS